jgi:cold-inducible RNA-binding protein
LLAGSSREIIDVEFEGPANSGLSNNPALPIILARVRCSRTLQKEDDVKNIFVGNLSFDTTEAAVRSMFEEFGAVDRVSIVTDRDTGRARGFGFVEMANDGEGQNAIAAINGRTIDGRALNVNEAKPKEDRGGRGGGGGRQNRW